MRLVCPLNFSTLYTTLPNNLIKEKLLDLIERAFKKFYNTEGKLYLACNNKTFFSSTDHRRYKLWSCQNVSFGYLNQICKLYRQIVGILMGTNCALVANLFLFCYEI